MTEQPVDDDSYPESWKPRHIRERERQEFDQRAEFEERVARLSDEAIDRIRKERS